MISNLDHARFERSSGLPRHPVLRGRRSNHERAIRHRIGNTGKHARSLQHVRAPDGGNGLPKRRIVRIYQAQIREPEIRHGARRRADIQRVPN